MKFHFKSLIAGWKTFNRNFIIFSVIVIYFLVWNTSKTERSGAYASTSIKSDDLMTVNKFAAKSSAIEVRKRLPQAIIIGAKKCGTSTLLEFLGHHPNIAANKSETHFFDVEEAYAAGVDKYLTLMPTSSPHQLTLEKTPRYFVNPLVPARIHAMNESIRLILIVKDPTNRVISDYAHLLVLGKEQFRPFERAVLDDDGNIRESSDIIEVSKYAVHLKRWLEFFSLDQFLFLDGDQLTRDPFSIMEKVENFLNLPPYFSQRNFYFSKSRGFYCFQTDQQNECISKGNGRKHPDVSPTLISQLRQYFVPFNDEFYMIVGKNFSWLTK